MNSLQTRKHLKTPKDLSAAAAALRSTNIPHEAVQLQEPEHVLEQTHRQLVACSFAISPRQSGKLGRIWNPAWIFRPVSMLQTHQTAFFFREHLAEECEQLRQNNRAVGSKWKNVQMKTWRWNDGQFVRTRVLRQMKTPVCYTVVPQLLRRTITSPRTFSDLSVLQDGTWYTWSPAPSKEELVSEPKVELQLGDRFETWKKLKRSAAPAPIGREEITVTHSQRVWGGGVSLRYSNLFIRSSQRNVRLYF